MAMGKAIGSLPESLFVKVLILQVIRLSMELKSVSQDYYQQFYPLLVNYSKHIYCEVIQKLYKNCL